MISPVEAWVAKRTGLNENLTAETLHNWQLAQVKKIIGYAREHSMFYRRRLEDFDENTLRDLADMQKIDFTYPSDIIRNPQEFLCVPQKEVARIITLFTSGSQGPPKRLFFTDDDLESTVDFFAWGMATMMGPGQKALILMEGKKPYTVGDLLEKALARIGVSGKIHGQVRNVTQAVAAARGAHCLIGIPGQIIHMARMDKSLRPQSVLLSADYVPESVIEALKDLWKCRIFTHYGMTEMGYGGGVQCEAGIGYHLRDADLLLEIIDSQTGRQVEPGQYGEIVVTMFSRQAMPLIRYRTGDMARLLKGICPCGGILPRLDKVTGRQRDAVMLKNGQHLSIHDLDEVMFAYPDICNYQAKLIHSPEREILGLTIAAKQKIDSAAIRKFLKEKFNLEIEIEINFHEINPYIGSAKRSIR